MRNTFNQKYKESCNQVEFQAIFHNEESCKQVEFQAIFHDKTHEQSPLLEPINKKHNSKESVTLILH